MIRKKILTDLLRQISSRRICEYFFHYIRSLEMQAFEEWIPFRLFSVKTVL